MTARPEPRDYAGAGQRRHLSTSPAARPLFEDRRARFVGDTLTINIAEKTQASKNSENKAERTQTVDAVGADRRRPAVQGRAGPDARRPTTANKFDGKGQNSSVQRLHRHHHRHRDRGLSQRQPAGVGREADRPQGRRGIHPLLRRGQSRPPSPRANTVQSTQVADARIEYKANGFIDAAQVMGWLARFFLTVLPF